MCGQDWFTTEVQLVVVLAISFLCATIQVEMPTQATTRPCRAAWDRLESACQVCIHIIWGYLVVTLRRSHAEGYNEGKLVPLASDTDLVKLTYGFEQDTDD